jgi:hypothetical protein
MKKLKVDLEMIASAMEDANRKEYKEQKVGNYYETRYQNY